jgi:molybdopterin synthase catalytic subunit
VAFSLSPEPIEVAVLHEQLLDPGAGACATFEGWVRNENEGRGVVRLDYEGYEAVAVKEGEAVLAEARERFGLKRTVCVHRVGSLEIGDMAVWVGVSADHRDAAFDGCRYIIDEIKHRLTIWKKEHYSDGDSGWINCQTGDAASAPRP